MKLIRWFVRKFNIPHEHEWKFVRMIGDERYFNSSWPEYECILCGEKETRLD